MSTSPPAGPSRRSLLRGAASVGVLALLASVPACATDGGADGSTGDGAPGDETASALLRLARDLASGPQGAVLDAARPPTSAPLASDADVVAVATRLDPEIRADLAAGRTVMASGWLLSRTEGAVLVAYAGACASRAC